MKKTDIIISGYYGFKNSGDDALLKAIIGNLRALKEDVTITVLSGNPKETQKLYDVDAINRFNFFKIFARLKNTKLLISGGGSLMQDVTSSKSLWYYLTVIRFALFCKSKVMLYANGIGPIFSAKNRKKVAKVLDCADCITLREDASGTELENLGITKPPVYITSDPVFSLKAEEKESVRAFLAENYGLNQDSKYFCVSVREWKYKSEDFVNVMAETADYVCEKYGLVPIFVPMQESVDKPLSREIIKNMKNSGYLLNGGTSVTRMLGIVCEAEFIIGMRLHTLIYAAGEGTPAIGLVYDPKVEAMMKYMGQEYHADVSQVSVKMLSKFVDEIVINKDSIEKQLRRICDEARQKAIFNAQLAIDLLN